MWGLREPLDRRERQPCKGPRKLKSWTATRHIVMHLFSLHNMAGKIKWEKFIMIYRTLEVFFPLSSPVFLYLGYKRSAWIIIGFIVHMFPSQAERSVNNGTLHIFFIYLNSQRKKLSTCVLINAMSAVCPLRQGHAERGWVSGWGSGWVEWVSEGGMEEGREGRACVHTKQRLLRQQKHFATTTELKHWQLQQFRPGRQESSQQTHADTQTRCQTKIGGVN